MSAADKAATALASAHDVDLAALAKGGDRRAFGQLVRRHGSVVRALVRRLGAEAGLADRIARDAFIDAYEQIGEFRGETPFAAWARRIAARACAKAARTQPDLFDGSNGPGEGGLDAALASLPTTERLCVGLGYGGGLSASEAGRALGETPETVRERRQAGLERLRAGLEAAPGVLEQRLERLFAEPPAFGDADLFALRVADRLDRRWTVRGAAIGALGLVGGAVVVAQAAASGVVERVQSLPHASLAAMGRALDHVLPWRLTISASPFAMDVILIPVVLAVLALGVAIARAIREI
jgi:RNA polymerase sigma-70 factor (ECF subfamily)